MEDIASLGFKVDSGPLDKASKSLDDLSGSAAKAEKATDRYSASSQKATGVLNSLGPAVTLVGTALATVAAGMSVEAIFGAADAYTEFSNRLTVAGVAAEDFAAVEERLFAAANKGGAEINAIASLYSRASLATEQLGASQEQLLNFVDGVSASLKVAGVSSTEASGALMQLSQALGAGTVRAEEFNSILEGAPTIAQAAANGIEAAEGSVAKLRAMVLEGQLTSKQFFDGFLIGSEQMKLQAEGLSLTLSNAFTVLNNGFIQFVGALNETVGLTAFLSSAVVAMGTALSWLASNLGTVAQMLAPLAPLFIGVFGPIVLAYVAQLTAAIGVGLYGAIVSLITLLIANPLSVFIGALVVVLGYMIDWEASIHAVINAWAIFVATWHDFWGNFEARDNTIRIAIDAKNAVSDLTNAANELANKAIAGISAGADVAAPKLAAGVSAGADQAAAKISQSVAMTADKALAIYENLNGKAVKEVGNAMVDGSNLMYNSVTGAVETASPQLQDSVSAGGAGAGEQIERSMTKGAQKASTIIYQTVESAFASMATWEQIQHAFWDRHYAEIHKIQAETLKMFDEGRAALIEANARYREAINNRGSGDGGGGGGGSGSGGRGGDTGGSLYYNTSQGRNFRLPKFIHYGNQPTIVDDEYPEGYGDVNITNVVDPSLVTTANQSAAGSRSIINVIAANRDEVASILGAY